jgi:hypothetical protein
MNFLPHEDIATEAIRLSSEATARQIPLRLLGGLAVYLRSQEVPSSLKRDYNDIDFAAPGGSSRLVTGFMTEMGYSEDFNFNVMQGHSRLLYRDEVNGRQVDVFVGGFRLCHSLPITDRLDLEAVTLPLVELLLTKLQVVHLNEKDLRDILALLYEHDVGETDGDVINATLAGRLCAKDWGLWRTVTGNLDDAAIAVEEYGLAQADVERVRERIDRFREHLDAAPKGRKWKLRSQIGDRVKWYDEPDEVF